MKKLKLSHSLFWIFFSTLIISGLNFLIFREVKKYRKEKYISKKYNIKTICQNKNDILDANYLAEIMNLSSDKASNIFLFDENKAKENLLFTPFIKNANIFKIKPNCLYVDYQIRKPLALLYDFENVAIDEDGYVFPIKPFYKDHDLCSIYIGLDNFEGFNRIETDQTVLTLNILKKIIQSGFADLVKLKILDTSRLQHLSYGKREIVLSIEEEIEIIKNQKKINLIFPKILRLAENNYLEQIANYLSLREKIMKDYENQIKNINEDNDVVFFKPKTVDLRISKLAFIDQ